MYQLNSVAVVCDSDLPKGLFHNVTGYKKRVTSVLLGIAWRLRLSRAILCQAVGSSAKSTPLPAVKRVDLARKRQLDAELRGKGAASDLSHAAHKEFFTQ